jgi:hypothetical protein
MIHLLSTATGPTPAARAARVAMNAAGSTNNWRRL